MAVYRKIPVNIAWGADRIVKEIKNLLSVSDSVEVRSDPANQSRLLLIAWRTEHVDWEEHQELH